MSHRVVSLLPAVFGKTLSSGLGWTRAARDAAARAWNEPRPLRAQLVLLVLATAIPLIGFCLVLLLHQTSQERRQYDQQLTQTVSSIAADIDRQIQAMSVTLRTLGTSRFLVDGRYSEFEAQSRRALGNTLALVLYDASGNKLIDTGAATTARGQVAIGAPIAGQILTPGDPQVSDLMYDTANGSPYIQVRMPLRDGDRLAFTIAMTFSPDLVRDILLAQRIPDGWNTGVSDGQNTVIARSKMHEHFLGTKLSADLVAHRQETGVFSARNLEGVPVYRTVTMLKSANWMIAATVPRNLVSAEMRSAAANLLIIAICALAASAGLAALLARRIAGHIAILGAADLQKPAAARLSPLPKGPVHEVNIMARILAAEVERRSEHEASIEQQRSFLNLVLTAVPSMVYIYDLAAKRTRFQSGAVGALLGYTQADIEAMADPMTDLLHPDDALPVSAHHDALKLSASDASQTLEYRMRHKDGHWHWLMSIDRPLRRDGAGRLLEILGVAVDITERKAMEADLALHASITKAAHDALIALDPQGRIEAWNPGAERVFGYTRDEVIGASAQKLSDPSHIPEQLAMIKEVLAGRIVGPLDTERRRRDGTMISVSISMSPVVASDGTITGVVKAAQDISERKRLEKRQALLTREIVHRGKNQLAVISSIARATARSTPEPQAFIAALTGRLQSLASAHDILINHHWERAELEDIAEAQLQPYADSEHERLRFSGPGVQLPSELAVPIGLALHELATNASKYGALSVPQGRVALDWTKAPSDDGGELLTITWREFDGPAINEPSRRGFGSTLIDRCVPNAEVERSFPETGLVCVLRVPLPKSPDIPEDGMSIGWRDAAQ